MKECAHCGGPLAGTPLEKMKEEHDRDFPGCRIETAVIICDDCYKEFVTWRKELSPDTEARLLKESQDGSAD